MILLALSLAIAISEPSFEKTRDDLVVGYNNFVWQRNGSGVKSSHSYFAKSLDETLRDFEQVTEKYNLTFEYMYSYFPRIRNVQTKNYNVYQCMAVDFHNKKIFRSSKALPSDIIIYYPQISAVYVDPYENLKELSIFGDLIDFQENLRKINKSIYDFCVEDCIGSGDYDGENGYFYRDYTITKATNDYISMITVGGDGKQHENAVTISLKTFNPMKLSDFISLKTFRKNLEEKKYTVSLAGKNVTKAVYDDPKLVSYNDYDPDSIFFYIKDDKIVIVTSWLDISMKIER